MRRLRAYCESRDLKVVCEYVDDGYSGRNTKRPAYKLMMSEPERRKWDIVMVLKMDRIHRNTREFMEMMDNLNRHGQNFYSVMDNVNTANAMGRFVMDTIQRIAQLESEQIGERTKMGMRQKAEMNDGIMGFTPPFGYDYSDGLLRMKDDESVIVRGIFDSYLSGKTLDDIAVGLNNSYSFTRKRNRWNKFNLRNILHNPIYAGYMRWEDVLIKHTAERIVTVSEFNEVQRMMAAKVRDPNKRNPMYLDERQDAIKWTGNDPFEKTGTACQS